MRYRKGMLAGAMLALLPLLASTAANAQKQGGTLRIFHRDSPANMSIHEEGTISVVAPIMPIFNNLVLFNQHEKQNRLDNIVPDLAESWSWSEDGKDLTFKLHQGTIYEFDETEEVFVPKSAFGMSAERVEALHRGRTMEAGPTARLLERTRL